MSSVRVYKFVPNNCKHEYWRTKHKRFHYNEATWPQHKFLSFVITFRRDFIIIWENTEPDSDFRLVRSFTYSLMLPLYIFTSQWNLSLTVAYKWYRFIQKSNMIFSCIYSTKQLTNNLSICVLHKFVWKLFRCYAGWLFNINFN